MSVSHWFDKIHQTLLNNEDNAIKGLISVSMVLPRQLNKILRMMINHGAFLWNLTMANSGMIFCRVKKINNVVHVIVRLK